MKTWFKTLWFALALLAVPVAANAQDAASDPAAKVIDAFHATLIDTMKKGKELGAKGRYKALEPSVEQTFNLPFMAQYTVGPAWAKFSDAEKADVIAAYKRMTVAEYAGNFDSFGGQTFTTSPMVQVRDKDHVITTTFASPGDKPVTFIYRMRQTADGSWKAIDVFLDGFVSQLATKRSDFATTVAQGAPALVKKLNDMADARLK